MKAPSPAATISVMESIVMGAAMLQANSRLDFWNARGAATLETLMIAVLTGICVAVVIGDQIWPSKWFQYAIAPVTALVSLGAFFAGTARFD